MLYFLIFFLGAVVGSFLNSVLWRLKKNKDFLFSRSICPHCKKTLSWHHLLPIFSFLIQKGKCAFCRKKISLHYPLIELLSGFLFLFIFWRFFDFLFLPSILKVILLWSIFALCLLIATYDLFHYEILNGFIILLFLFGIFYLLSEAFFGQNFFLFSHFLGGLLGAGLLFPFYYFSKETLMGGGDVKLMAGLGMILGAPLVLVSLFFAFTIGGAVAGFLLLFKIKELKDPLPFGPFLVLGFFLALFFSNFILNFQVGWY